MDQEQSKRFGSQLRRVRLRHLEVILAISDHGSLSATARAIGSSQPAVSQWLVEVEDALGVPLFVRGRVLKPTQALPIVLRHVRRMVADSEQLAEELQAAAAGTQGVLRIGTMPVASARLLPAALLLLRREGGEQRVSIVEDIAQGLWSRFEQRELDLIVGRLDERAHAAHLSREPLFADPHCIVAGTAHPLSRRNATWLLAAEQPWILPPAGTRLRSAVDATFIDHGLAPPVPWIESVSPLVNQALMRDSLALNVVSGAAARHYEASKSLRILGLRLSHDVGRVGMAWDSRENSPALHRMLAALRKSARLKV